MSDPLVQQFVTLTPEVKRRLAARADSAGTNFNDVAVALLAQHYGATFEPTGRTPSERAGESLNVTLRMPSALQRTIRVSAASKGHRIGAEIVAAFEKQLGEPATV